MATAPSFLGNLVGVNFVPKEARELIPHLTVGQELKLEREPDNAWDENAVKILLDVEEDEPVFIGHLERGTAGPLAQWLDAGHGYTVRVHSPTDDKRRPWLLEFTPNGERNEIVEPPIDGDEPPYTDDDIPF